MPDTCAFLMPSPVFPRVRAWRRLCVALAVVAHAAVAQSRPLSGTRVFTGNFITLDSVRPRAAALAVKDGRIVAIGSVAHVDSVVGRGAARERLPGFALPGFADAHVHASALGDVLATLDLRGASKAQLLARVGAAARRAPAGQWIRGGGWDQSFWNPPAYPSAMELDAVSAGHPVILERIDGHAVWANSTALARAGIDRATPDPAGGRLLRGAGGDPTGILIDAAMPLVRRAEPALTLADRMRRLRRALEQYASWGLTSVHDAGVDHHELAAYHALARAGPLPVRVYAMAAASDPVLAEVLARGPELGAAGGTFTLRTIKVVDDGALGSRGARLGTPYADEPSQRGFSLVTPGSLDTLISRARAQGFQVAVHAIGDASNHDVLDAFERADARDARFRLEHASMIRDADVPRLSQLGVIASMQPVFVGEYSRFAEARVGPERLPWVYRTRDVVLSGARVAAGTDFPASDTGDPIATLVAMVTRQGYDGLPREGWVPRQGVSVNVAIRSMTVDAAFAAFDEDESGQLTVGRRADLTVVSMDPFALPPDRLRDIRVLHTFLGGRRTGPGSAARR